MEERRYKLRNIREFLVRGFSEPDLRRLCSDTPELRPVLDELKKDASKAELVDALLDFAKQRLLIDTLLEQARERNPWQYQKYGPYYEGQSWPEPEQGLTQDDEGIPAPAPLPPGLRMPLDRNPASQTLETQPTWSRPLRVFLCYASGDKPAVRNLYQRLRTDGLEPWLDEEDLLPGQDWQLEIPKAVRAADVVLVCLSSASITKAGYAQKEIKFALDVADEQPEGTIYLIPLRLESCEVPERLRRWQWVNLFEERGYERLMRALRKRAEAIEQVKTEVKPKTEPEPKRQPPPSPSTRLPFEPEMILIPASEFLMGSDPKVDKEARKDEQPQHTLYLPDYYLAKTPVTNAQYAVFVKVTGHRLPYAVEADWAKPYNRHGQTPPTGQENHPVVLVDWHHAVAYCQWLAEVTGKPYRLPSEAEWEKGARGTYGRIYPWGNRWDSKRCNSREGGKRATTPVDAYPDGASPYGLLDMAGNVWEWTRSLYRAYPYNPADGREDLKASGVRVWRGGSFLINQLSARCASRGRSSPNLRDYVLGFRVVVSPIL